MKNFKGGSLEINLSKEGNKNLMQWHGQSVDRSPSALLNPYLDGLINDLKGTELIVDFIKLEYMNSSTVPPIIQFLKNIDASGITTTITYDANSKWQAASFKALETLALMMNNITVTGK